MTTLDTNNKAGNHATDEAVEIVTLDDSVVNETRGEKRKREREAGQTRWEKTRKRLATYCDRVGQTNLSGREIDVINNREVVDLSRMSDLKREALYDMAVDSLRRKVETFLVNFPQGRDFTMVINTPQPRSSS